MTDRLSDLLHGEADTLDVPPAPVDQVVARGRAVRRRRRTTTTVVGAVAAIVVLAAGTAAMGLHRSDSSPEPAKLPDQAAYQQLGAWARGDEVHVGNHVVVVPGTERLQYTSVGVVVTSADSTRTLVDPEGDVRPLDLDLHTGHGGSPTADKVATDATEPYLAYIQVTSGDQGQLTVRDLSTGEETTVGEPFDTGGSGAVYSLWGDQAFYVRGTTGRLVDWRTGEKVAYPQTQGTVLTFGGLGHGAALGYDDDADGWVISSRTDDRTLLEVPASAAGINEQVSLSVDGRYFAITAASGFDVYNVETGSSVHVEGRRVEDYGWTPDGHLVGKPLAESSSEVETCDPDTGACRGTGVTVGTPLTLVTTSTSR